MPYIFIYICKYIADVSLLMPYIMSSYRIGWVREIDDVDLIWFFWYIPSFACNNKQGGGGGGAKMTGEKSSVLFVLFLFHG